MISKVGSLEEKVKLPPTETISRCYQPPQGNRKVIRILTVAVYVLCVSLAAIMLSLYYIFIWDPTVRPFVTKANNCEKIVIPEKIAIRLLNSSEVTAEQFYRHILEQYRILNQLQQQRQIFLQKQHLQLQQLAAGNKFQEVFATATIIQPNSHDLNKKPITPTNGTFLLEPPRLPPIPGMDTIHVPILDTTPMRYRRKQHRKHYSHHNRHSGSTNINNQRRSHKRPSTDINKPINEPPLSPSTSIVKEIAPYTAMPIPLILNSQEDKRPLYTQSEKKSNSLAMSHKRITSSGYDTQPYLNPFLTGELIFEK